MVPFGEALEDVSRGKPKLPQSAFRSAGRFPVVDQGQSLIAGFSDDELMLSRVSDPVIIFGDHTRAFKYVDFPFVVGADGVKVLRVRPGWDPKYVFHYLKSTNIPSAGYSRHFKFLKEIGVPKPALEEQRRVAAMLDQADALRAKRRRARVLLDELTKSMFMDRFGHPMRTREWPKATLGSVARIVRGASPRPAGDPRYFGGDIPWLKISDVTAAPGRVVTEVKETVTAAGRDKSVLLPASTLILTNSATVGVAKVIAPETCIHDGFLAFLDLDDERIDQTWLYAALSVSRPSLELLAPQGTQKNLNGPIVKGVEFSLPPIDQQRAFANHVSLVESLTSLTSDSHEGMETLALSIQQRAFSGALALPAGAHR